MAEAGAKILAAHPHSTHGAAVLQDVRLREASPGRSFVPSSPAYLLSNQEPTLDETVQHLLTVAVGRLARLGMKKKSMGPQDSQATGHQRSRAQGTEGAPRPSWRVGGLTCSSSRSCGSKCSSSRTWRYNSFWLSNSIPCSSQGPSGGTLPASSARTAQAGKGTGHEEGSHPLA